MRKRKTTEQFIAEAKLTHGDKYDYSKVNYTGVKNKVTVICYIHGDFSQMPSKHILGRGCHKCGGTVKSTTEEFILKAIEIHGNKYLYDNVNYNGNKKQITIICPVHGSFEQTPAEHLSGCGCYKCSLLIKAKKTYLGVDKFIKKAQLIHGTIYDYSQVNYINTETKVDIICATHGVWKQKPGNHLNGNGCPSCANYGFDKSKPAILYYLKIITDTNQVLYKIGITNRTVNERFNLTDLSKIEIVKQKLYDNGQDALDWETKLKRMYKEYQYKGPDILSSGNTELFTEDIIAILECK